MIDAIDIAEGTSVDDNGNGVPDECDCSGDTNGDGIVDVVDLVNVILDWGTDGSANGGDQDGSGSSTSSTGSRRTGLGGLCLSLLDGQSRIGAARPADRRRGKPDLTKAIEGLLDVLEHRVVADQGKVAEAEAGTSRV